MVGRWSGNGRARKSVKDRFLRVPVRSMEAAFSIEQAQHTPMTKVGGLPFLSCCRYYIYLDI
eukprot:11148757-Lingulodinium_polyedra.AAC.1